MRWSQGSVTVRFDIPNKPWDNDHKEYEKDDPENQVGNYMGNICLSPKTEVTEL